MHQQDLICAAAALAFRSRLTALCRTFVVLACLLALTALATIALDLDTEARDFARSLSVLAGTWQ